LKELYKTGMNPIATMDTSIGSLTFQGRGP